MQNNDQIYHYLKNSLAAPSTDNFIAETSKYYIVDNPYGMLIFKRIMKKAIVDTTATTSSMRKNLKRLYSYIATVNSDIEKLNGYAKKSYEALDDCGEICNGMMSNLFKVYHTAGYTELVSNIKHHKY